MAHSPWPMPAPTLPRHHVDVYLGAVNWLRGIPSRTEVVESWSRPSRIDRYTIGGVAAHAAHGVLWLEQVLKDAEPVVPRILSACSRRTA